ncbi:hypothetical protein BFW01_g3636 [Lasiodiplodia theobromae]|uniref:uncharacterized protein n=1 Tax=Lasiodiplodia theobromae TaxID=45133 RepID=UPI0015C3E90D|nr:uncharacterized protein LTHEOB_8659 [Lasiodiplodia theobromae]KAF4541263.1 hypothetical protein LTHEOB_8659 [Lasiodiplodia theobromae]KAF9632773.1 hypothetical protein BFW01_g3636 [Lasiodiplodia theobromae]
MKGLYNLYKKDEQARSAHERVCFMEDIDEYGPLYPQFEDAICDLPNLREIEILGPDLQERPMWRGSYFDPKIAHEFDLRVDEAVAAAPTAFALRSIGLRNSSNSSLTCLTLEFTTTWWGPRDVQKAWESMVQYQIFDDDSDDGSTNSDHETSNKAAWVRGQMALTRGAFTHLKTLRLRIKMEQAALDNHCKALGDWFASAPGLQFLDLCTMCDDDDGFYDTLKGIVEHCQLPALQDLRLQVQDTSINSLIALLSRVSHTLRSLQLYWCMVTEDGDTWPNFYERMREIPFKQLCHLDFTRCADFDQDIPEKSHDEDLILAVKEYVDDTRDSVPTEIVVHASLGPQEMRKGYSSDLYRYLLKKTSVMPPLYLYYIEDEDSSVGGP